jgi:hypothetical protein
VFRASFKNETPCEVKHDLQGFFDVRSGLLRQP